MAAAASPRPHARRISINTDKVNAGARHLTLELLIFLNGVTAEISGIDAAHPTGARSMPFPDCSGAVFS